MFRLPAANQGHIGKHIFRAFPGGVFVIPWFIQILNNFILPWKNSYQWEQKQVVITTLLRRDSLASSFSFWFAWRKSWRVNLHVWSLFDLWKFLAQSVVQSLFDLTIIATDEECFNSSESDCFMTCKRTASSQQNQWKNDRISRSSRLKKNNWLY